MMRFLATFFVLIASVALARDVDLAWDGTDSRNSGAIGFKVNSYAKGGLSSHIDVGDVEQTTLKLASSGTYKFDVIAYDAEGQSSAPSNQISFTPASLLNISTRGFVGVSDAVLIGGFVVGGEGEKSVLLRALGPSLAAYGLIALSDPILELHDSSGLVIAANDDWRSDQSEAISSTGLAPTDDRESAIATTLQPGNYTAILRGKNDAIGIAMIEIFDLRK